MLEDPCSHHHRRLVNAGATELASALRGAITAGRGHFGALARAALLAVPFTLLTALLTTPLAAQVPGAGPEATSAPASSPRGDTIPRTPGEGAHAYDHLEDAPVAQAVRLVGPAPVIDGRPDESIWLSAPPATGLRQLTPDEGAPATQRSEVRFLYDDENLYVGGWFYDEAPPVTHPARRDASMPQSDRFAVYFDTYHDHRTAFRFMTNGSSLKKDEIVIGERQGPAGRTDLSWDPVWEVRSSVTGEGWFTEMRIPFSQLRYGKEEVQHWGVQIERVVRRLNEETFWAHTPRRERGGVARMGHLEGIRGIAQGKRLEVLPYLSGRAEYMQVPRAAGASFTNPFRSGSDYFGSGGVDLKYRLTSDFTLSASVNPDFGQVELDPAVINLTAFETRFEEQRPLFVEGADIFRVGEAGARAGPKTPQILYTRRIGRAPQGSAPDSAVYSEAPVATTILGALKVTGKTASGWSVGAMNVLARRELQPYVGPSGSRGEAVVEPLSNYTTVRVRRDLRGGAASLGVIGTAVQRDLDDPALRSLLRSSAYAFGVDGRLEWDNRRWLLSGTLSPSHTRGDAGAINRAQRSSARYLHRPDAEHLAYDPTATSLTGFFGRGEFAKRAGAWQGGVALTAITPGYEINDLGFQTAADRIYLDLDWGYEQTRPGRHLREWSVSLAPSGTWNFAGDPQGLGLALGGAGQLLSFHTFSWEVARQFDAWDDRLTRGGPMARLPGSWSASVRGGTQFSGPLQIRANLNASKDDAGGWTQGGALTLAARIGQRIDLSAGPDLARIHGAAQYVTSVADPLAGATYGRRYLFAPLDQTTLSVPIRFSAAFSQGLTLELFAQPLISSGDYGALMELAGPRSFDFRHFTEVGTLERLGADAFRVDPDGAGPASAFEAPDLTFNSRSLLGNAVLRWEWRPGSTLFLVWQQSRSERITPDVAPGVLERGDTFDLGTDTRALFELQPNNIFLVKLNFWMNP